MAAEGSGAHLLRPQLAALVRDILGGEAGGQVEEVALEQAAVLTLAAVVRRGDDGVRPEEERLRDAAATHTQQRQPMLA